VVDITGPAGGPYGFSPKTITIRVGSSVKWVDNTDSPHTSHADSGTWNSGNIAVGGTFSFTFTRAGTYTYHCDYHPYMTGTIIVTA
jgi:plastocyanin